MDSTFKKNVSSCLNTNIYSYLETSGGQSYNLYLNIVHFLTLVLIRHLWQLRTFIFLHWCLKRVVFLVTAVKRFVVQVQAVILLGFHPSYLCKMLNRQCNNEPHKKYHLNKAKIKRFLRAVFTTLHFLLNSFMEPISQSVCPLQAFQFSVM